MTDKQTARNGIGRGTPGPGRRKGVPNKLTQDMKEISIGAFHKAGGEAYLVQQAKKHPQAFMTLLGKGIPRQIEGTLQTSCKRVA